MVYLFSNQKSRFGKILEGLAMEDDGIPILLPFGLFYGHFVYFVAIWYILWLFGIFFLFWYVVPLKLWQP
jgi:hypothetical protein